MEWLSELIKHITVSRSFTGAVFVTSAGLLSGPRWAPSYFEALPKEWVVAITGALIFSGVLLFFWFVPAVWTCCIKAFLWLPNRLISKTLNKNEQAIMLLLAERADEPLNLSVLNYASGYASKLEVLELCSSLSRKGLLNINPYDENLNTLSPEGRRCAIELMTKKRA